jgi:ectoine hydroxylase-related dioxygenase (phytanoyl-CoA dioxygenase family)
MPVLHKAVHVGSEFMEHPEKRRKDIEILGYTTIPAIYTGGEIDALTTLIRSTEPDSETFRKSNDLFAIRQLLKEVPQAAGLVFNEKLQEVIFSLFGRQYFVVKSIYFDKPGSSNWFVSYHQGLTISVRDRFEVSGFGPWSVKQNQFAVVPPVEILEENFTVRIHLDDTDENNGALRVVPGSHRKGIYRPETIDWNIEQEATCCVPRGGIMIMRPLLLHASSRSTSNRKRRVIHIEFACQELPEPLQWSERLPENLLPTPDVLQPWPKLQ